VLYNGGILQLIKAGTALSFQVSDIVASFEVRMRAKYPVVGWTASQCVTPDAQGWYAAGYISGANPDLGTTSVSSYTEITNSALTLTPDTGSAAMGITCSSSNSAAAPSTSATTCSAGNESVGFAVSVPRAGRYQVCFDYTHSVGADSGVQAAATFQVVTTATNSQTILAEGGPKTQSGYRALTIASGVNGAAWNSNTSCGEFNLSAGTNAFRLMYEQIVSGTPDLSWIMADADANQGQRSIRVTMKPVSQQQQVLLANSVVSNNQAGTDFFGASTTAADCTTTPCTLTSGSTPGVTITRNSTGNYTVNYGSLGLSKVPFCTAGDHRGQDTYKCNGGSVTNTSTSIFCYQNTTGNTWALVDSRPSIVCGSSR
jgi:hypothetical protein